MKSPRISMERLLEHEDFVRGLAQSLVLDPARADDVVQETWLAALRRPPRQLDRLRSWLGTVVKNFARQDHRAEGRRRRRETERTSGGPIPTPDEILERETARRELVEAVAQLPTLYRTVVLLRFFEDLPPRRIAAQSKATIFLH